MSREITLTNEEIAKHTGDGDVWVVHNDGVYNVSKFVEKHPGLFVCFFFFPKRVFFLGMFIYFTRKC